MQEKLKGYPFRTIRKIDGEDYIKVSELNEILDNLEKLGPVFAQIASASEQLRKTFQETTREEKNLLVEAQKFQEELKDI